MTGTRDVTAQPVVLIHKPLSGSPQAYCGLLYTDADTAPTRYRRIPCPGCHAPHDPRTFDEGLTEGWERARLFVKGAALAWRTQEGRRAFGELLDLWPGGGSA